MAHPNEMTKAELLALVHDMGTLALDLYHHLRFCQHLMKLPLLDRATSMTFDLCNYPYSGKKLPRRSEIAVFGKDGLRVERG